MELSGVKMKKLTTIFTSIVFMLTCLYSQKPASRESTANIWQESVSFPTFLVDDPDPNPRFYDGRAYQGAQGRVYPYPIYESLSDTRVMKDYDLVYLENEYIKIDILPEIGGRLFGALDKTNGYDFIYRQHVIKPALIGMLGAWISGGIEWNFPHHHRATAYMPVDYTMVENADGSSTLWIGELEIRHRMKFMLGLTVYPGKSYFEVTFRPFNRTPFAHSFLYFANTGVHTNEQYQVLFPPATQFGTYHGKNQFVQWPIAHEVYNRVDYTEGVDISWWKNHPEWTSIFCWNYEDDFVGGYDHGKEAGILCLSNHHIGPGKKFWTWSTGPRGQMWDVALTETDGPELEIMIGGYSDNQPDYSWLQPYESKYLKQYFYPIRELKSIKNANLEAAVNLERTAGNRVLLAFNTTAERKNAKVVLQAGDEVLFEEEIDIDPSLPFSQELSVPEAIKDTELKASLISSTGDELISYQPVEIKKEPMPEEAVPPKPPAEIETVEELYMTGLRLEQFYNPSFKPEPYYQEALARDPSNYRVNAAVGLQYLRKGIYEEAEDHFKVAVNRITNNHTKPRDGEAYYYLGLCQQYMGKYGEAYKNLYQATWSQAFHSAAYFHLAQLDCMKGNYETALGHLDRSLTTSHCNTRAWGLKSTVLRKLGNTERALEISQATEKNDPLDIWSGFEIYLCHEALGNSLEANHSLESINNRFHDYVQTYLELSLDYANAGFWEDAVKVLTIDGTSLSQEERKYPLWDYFLGYYHQQLGDIDKAVEHYRQASGKSPEYCFPFRLESMRILEGAIKTDPADAKALYYLGNLLFEIQPERAITLWEEASGLEQDFPTLYRNLGWAYYKVRKDIPGAIRQYEKAVALDNKDQRLLYELDLVYADGRVSPEKRLKKLQDNHQAIAENNVSDALARQVMLLVQLGRYDQALEVANNNYFRQWEGVSKAYSSYVDAYLLRGWEHFQEGKINRALEDYLAALKYPENMMVAEPYRGGRSTQVHYFIGTAYEKMGDLDKAEDHYRKAATKRQHRGHSEIHFYKALALDKLEKNEEAGEIFEGLIRLGRAKLENPEEDFFAKFGEKQTADDQKADAYYLVGLGYLGQGENISAHQELAEAVKLNSNHIWAAALLSQLEAETILTVIE
jgi:tetratricopeptide (TPR) repeat protein